MRLRILLFALLFLAPGAPVRAHAYLIESDPGANAQVSTAPEAIRLRFSEPIEQSFSTIRVIDLAGTELLHGGIVDPSDPFTLSLDVTDDLPEGIYTVSWRVFSTADGHNTQGHFAFGIGMAAGTRSTQIIDETIRPESAGARVLDMLGTALTLGVLVFAFTVWRPGRSQGLPVRDLRFLRLMRAGWYTAGVGLVLGLLAQSANLTGTTLAGSITDGSIIRLLAESSYGPIWLGRVVVWGIFGFTLFAARTRPALWGALFGLGIGMAVFPSLVSHARSLGTIDALINDMVHRITAALWVGGLIAWVGALWPDLTLAVKPVSRAVNRFSNLARFYVMLLAAGGLFAAIQHIPSGEALLETVYGRALTVKGLLFGLMFVLAAFNLLVVERRLRRGVDAWIPVLRISVSAEMMLGAVLMLMSAVMASTVPSRDVLTLRAQTERLITAGEGIPYFGMEIQDPVMLHFEIYPGIAGENEFIVSPYSLPETEPIVDATRVWLQFTHQDLGTSELVVEPDGSGNYIAMGENLSIPGEWQIRITLERPGETDTILDFDVTIPLP